MLEKFLNHIRCPHDYGELDLGVFLEDGVHVIEGKLTCKICGREYPVIGGVPRLLPDHLFYYSTVYHAEYFDKHKLLDGEGEDTRKKTVSDATARTLKSFSYQWRKFGKMFDFWKDNFVSPHTSITFSHGGLINKRVNSKLYRSISLKISDLSALNYAEMRIMMNDIRRKARAFKWNFVPIVITNHTKDIKRFRAIEKFCNYLSTCEDISIITSSELVQNIFSGK